MGLFRSGKKKGVLQVTTTLVGGDQSNFDVTISSKSLQQVATEKLEAWNNHLGAPSVNKLENKKTYSAPVEGKEDVYMIKVVNRNKDQIQYSIVASIEGQLITQVNTTEVGVLEASQNSHEYEIWVDRYGEFDLDVTRCFGDISVAVAKSPSDLSKESNIKTSKQTASPVISQRLSLSRPGPVYVRLTSLSQDTIQGFQAGYKIQSSLRPLYSKLQVNENVADQRKVQIEKLTKTSLKVTFPSITKRGNVPAGLDEKDVEYVFIAVSYTHLTLPTIYSV
eukprot:TRINITY_DN8407_c0_g1_i11.p1 TRINITY_DN8407_c0_g1~~TRINITY_DN8407_c0_g1_i11.p1  ORF type:complete len:310 (+),score=81.04 TRINITY_DN8407_c0_g1_i11:96-932(+)